MSRVKKLEAKGLITPPKWVADNIQYETIMGSVAYGLSNASSDVDIYGFCLPPKEDIFPHLRGEIIGFGRHKQKFEQFQQHHVFDRDDSNEYDMVIYSIVKYFQLCMDNNPNMIDSLFTPARCVLHSTQIGQMVRENRKMFLHKGSWHKFKGYAYSQLNKMEGKAIKKFVDFCTVRDLSAIDVSNSVLVDKTFADNHEILDKLSGKDIAELHSLMKQCTDKNGKMSKRLPSIIEHGYDVKFAYHVVRLLNEVEQILEEGDIDLQRNREQLKSIRRGEWKLEDIKDYFDRNEKRLEQAYTDSKLQHSPDEGKIKQLLLNCLEHHYGNLEKCVVNVDASTQALKDIQAVLDRVNK